MLTTPTAQAAALRAIYAAREFKWFSGTFDLNLIGLRGRSTLADSYDDAIGAVWWDGSAERSVWFRASTDPGAPILEAPTRKAGAGILIPGQHRGSHRVGTHHGATNRPALVATGPLQVWRDADRDRVLDPVEVFRAGGSPKIEEGFGVNIHSGGGSRVGRYSELCQVTAGGQPPIDVLIELVREQERRGHGATVSYTLIDWSWAPDVVDGIIGAAS